MHDQPQNMEPGPVMRLRKIKISNFKSLVDFEMDLADFTCLVGLNGAGKSTILQALDFLSQLMKGDVSGWLKSREWEAVDLKSKLSKASNISFELVVDYDGLAFKWIGAFNRTSLRCTHEVVLLGDHVLVNTDSRGYLIATKKYLSSFQPSPEDTAEGKVNFEYQGSVLSVIKDSVMHGHIVEFKRFVTSITSLDALSPQALRKRSRGADGSLGFAGEKLSAFIHQLSAERLQALEALLSKNYPHLKGIVLSSLRAGWKSLGIQERYGSAHFTTDARHMNDGLLRLMAILAETLSSHQFMLFDEIENGINAELIEFLLDYLVSVPRQIMVTTHSPMILNYLDDDIARKGVQLIYKQDDGKTRSIPFFSIPSVAEKLTVMGPGEVFVDTDLIRLPEEIARMNED